MRLDDGPIPGVGMGFLFIPYTPALVLALVTLPRD
jgi:hypothetical protein